MGSRAAGNSLQKRDSAVTASGSQRSPNTAPDLQTCEHRWSLVLPAVAAPTRLQASRATRWGSTSAAPLGTMRVLLDLLIACLLLGLIEALVKPVAKRFMQRRILRTAPLVLAQLDPFMPALLQQCSGAAAVAAQDQSPA